MPRLGDIIVDAAAHSGVGHKNQEPDGQPLEFHPQDGDLHPPTNGNASARTRSDETSTAGTPRPPHKHAITDSPASAFRTYRPSTPSTRTGPPRTLSYTFSLPNSPIGSRANSGHESDNFQGLSVAQADDYAEQPGEILREFRSPWDYDPNKRRESRVTAEDSWNPLRWFQDSPSQEKAEFDWGFRKPSSRKHTEDEHITEDERPGPSQTVKSFTFRSLTRQNTATNANSEEKNKLRRTASDPHTTASPGREDGEQKSPRVGLAKWRQLRRMLPQITNHPIPGPSAVTHHSVNITDELITGGLSTLMLRLWFERDEKERRRVPILLHRLRIRVSDSIHPLTENSTVFRIECEYANGAARWVVYRQLRDFISLHAHYTLSNAYNRNVDSLPEFPKTSLPYLKFLNKDRSGGNKVSTSEFARLQREALEDYLIQLIRSVMFHPASNRLSAFLEISALSISLAQSGGAQYKAGYMEIEAESGGFGRKTTGWREKRQAHWCAVRESYLVVMTEPGETTVWDVFMLDSDFKIERPKRYYRQGLNLLQGTETEKSQAESEQHNIRGHDGSLVLPGEHHDNASHTRSHKTFSSIRSRISQILHFGHNSRDGHDHDDVRSSSSSTTSSSHSPEQSPPMLDPSTNANPLIGQDEQTQQDNQRKAVSKKPEKDVSKHTFFIENSQMRLKLFAKNERQMLQWITAFERIASNLHYTGSNRFNSFAPIRLNVAAQWLVDGRDYFWNLSRAIMLAKETIYIHDWWLSPELLLRRPNMTKYRLDNLLERKAKEGVKIHIILYQEVSNRTTPTDSNYAKQRLTSLHPNIMVQRSPSHFQTGTFYWAHHEKLCVIDETIAFTGGVDLCFGRWDTPQHALTDYVEDPENDTEIWPGKDYSNPRILDFHTLSKPEEDMYDRTRIPRMPWHDVGMQIVGQPARDLARHFVQRWNYLLRIKKHSRTMPFLVPPPEFKPGELIRMGLTGTCEMQICRSCGPWSMGTPSHTEQSIQNAYLKAIQMSEHFVYIENQFFITSTVVNDTKVENRIGDALVDRIIRAYRENTPWKCCIVIPLLPGFTFPVDHSDASAIRIILECQNRTIARGPNSIFSRLRKEGINPDDYISVFSLRNWAKLKGDVLTTEQVYIHGKVCVVDDRLAIIGSANINERSQRGDRDSEIAVVIRDTDMIDSTMAGKRFQVGRFSHTLRVRLMREHLGIDVDALDAEDMLKAEPTEPTQGQELWDPDQEQQTGQPNATHVGETHSAPSRMVDFVHGAAHAALHGTREIVENGAEKIINKATGRTDLPQTAGDTQLEDERTTFDREGNKEPGFASAIVPTLEEKTVIEHLPPKEQANDAPIADKLEKEGGLKTQLEEQNECLETNNQQSFGRTFDGELYGAPAGASRNEKTDDQPPHAYTGISDAQGEENAAPEARATLRKHVAGNTNGNKWIPLPIPRPQFGPDDFEDPVNDGFWKQIWVASAAHNTEIYRKVFHAIPDDLVTTWKQYREFIIHHERMNKPPRDCSSSEAVGRAPSESLDEDAPGSSDDTALNTIPDSTLEDAPRPSTQTSSITPEKQRRTKPGTEPFERWERDEMEVLLGQLCGHLVLYPNRFLEGEDIANNFLFNADRMLPLPIYN